LWVVRMLVHTPAWRMLLALAGLSAPFLLLFYGHLETYAPAFAAAMAWWAVWVRYQRSRKVLCLWLLLPLLLLCIRLHTLQVLLVPVWGLALLQHYAGKAALVRQLLRPRCLGLLLGGGALLAWSILYFWVVGDYNDPRMLRGIEPGDRLFLPLLSPEAPLDCYNLLSWNHAVDLLNMLLFWCPLALAVVLGAVMQRKQLRWDRPLVVYPLLAFGLMFGLLCTINPLLSMPMDWDLFSLPAPVLLVLAAGLGRQLERLKRWKAVLPAALAIAVLCVPAVLVNVQPQAHAERLATVGVRIYKSYYERSGDYLNYALKLSENAQERAKREQAMLQELLPYRRPAVDSAYAALLIADAQLLLDQYKDTLGALDRVERAYLLHPGCRELLGQAQLLELLGRREAAARRRQQLKGRDC